MEEEAATTSASAPAPAVHTYHCICSTFILATTHTLDALPTRAAPARDQAIILPLPSSAEVEHGLVGPSGYSTLQNTTRDRKPVIVRREDGFEKRTFVRCGRCNAVLGYGLDESQFTERDGKADEVVYLLPGGLMSTADMRAGKVPDVPEWAKETS